MKRALAASALGFTLACAGAEPATPSAIRALPSPAGVLSGEPSLSTGADGSVHLTWIEPAADSQRAVRYARLEGDTWSTPSTIVARNDLFVNWADFPSVISSRNGMLTVHWLQRSAPGKYSYDIRVARSTDGGATWSAGELLNRDGKAAEHGFLSFWPASDSTVEAAWLDGRDMVGDHGGAHGTMQVATTTLHADGSLGVEEFLDNRTCECCQVSAAVASSGPVVVYRDRSEANIRDIAIVRRVNGSWTTPALVHNDGWFLEGCPVNGPAIDASGESVVVAWYTGARDTARVNVAFSTDGGATFTPPIRVDEGTPAGRVDLVRLSDSEVAVSWLERVGDAEARVLVRHVNSSGSLAAPVTVASTKAERASGFPRMVLRGDELIAAWTEPGTESQVRMSAIPLVLIQPEK